MYEVVATYRADFSEHRLNCFATEEEARQYAQDLAVKQYAQVVRTRVRLVPNVKAPQRKV